MAGTATPSLPVEAAAARHRPAPSIWAIEPAYFAWLQGQLGRAGDVTAEPAVPAGAPSRLTPAQGGAVAVLPLRGPISKRQTFWSLLFGGASTEGIAAAFREAMANEMVGSIVLDIDSPGGTVYGVPELADEIYRARGTKPIVAVANDLLGSAAYHIASAADTIYVTPSSLSGSIGVFVAHLDMSRALDAEGLTVSLISAGRYKVEANPYEPLGDEARAALQREIDYYYGLFTEAVARGRSREGARITAAAVRDGYGQGRMLTAKDAVGSGLVDRIARLDDVVSGLARGRRGGTRAERLATLTAYLDARERPVRPELEDADDAQPSPGSTVREGLTRRGRAWNTVARRLSR